ncbi:hypothetical protein [Rhizobium sp. Root1220]|uniref:hypothetical protein n=1 Tax=Rhizobium sp. Root1220 TaxID=1736432 RepID=UPI0006FA496D|nr:hypothetical protein [Rhizobium sp. Root1220]KQV84356.1 hypothetical protein ASC90_02205 [Rhizobium sp. Root1220]
MSSQIEWPEGLGFMLLELERTKLTNIIETPMNDGSIKKRPRRPSKDAWRGEARFTPLEEDLMRSMVGKRAVADIPGEKDRRRLTLMGDDPFYPGYAPQQRQVTWSNVGPTFSIIRYFIRDEGPLSEGALKSKTT